jgi:hypothetical protein
MSMSDTRFWWVEGNGGRWNSSKLKAEVRGWRLEAESQNAQASNLKPQTAEGQTSNLKPLKAQASILLPFSFELLSLSLELSAYN